MKIEQSAVSMNADHRLTSEYEARLESRISFRTLFDGVAQTGESPASGETDRQTRLLMMIEALLARLLALISGKHNSLMSDVCALLGTEIPKGGAGRPLRALEMEWNNEFTQIFHRQAKSVRRMAVRSTSSSNWPCVATSSASERLSIAARR